jgi:hypothetical protein
MEGVQESEGCSFSAVSLNTPFMCATRPAKSSKALSAAKSFIDGLCEGG